MQHSFEYSVPIVSDRIMEQVKDMTAQEQKKLISDLLVNYATVQHNVTIPDDFIELLICSLVNLQDSGCADVIYALCKGLGTRRPDGCDSVFPTTRMPMGLLQYIVQFFITKPGKHVSYIHSLY